MAQFRIPLNENQFLSLKKGDEIIGKRFNWIVTRNAIKPSKISSPTVYLDTNDDFGPRKYYFFDEKIVDEQFGIKMDLNF